MAASSSIPAPELELTTESNAGETIVRGTGKINLTTAGLLQSTVRQLIPDNKRIVLDLTAVEYIDSTGLGALVSVYLAASKAKLRDGALESEATGSRSAENHQASFSV